MSGFKDARTLRLERLESRSLLAAGVFDFAVDAGGDKSGRSHSDRPSQTQELSSQPKDAARDGQQSSANETQRSRDESRGSKSDRKGDSARDNRRSGHKQRPDDNRTQSEELGASAIRLSEPLQSQSRQNQPVQFAIAPAISGQASVPLAATTTSLALPADRSTNQIQSIPRAGDNAAPVDSAVTLIANESANASSENSAVAQATDIVAATNAVKSSSVDVDDRVDVERRNETRESDQAIRPSVDNGLIELAPLRSFEPTIGDSEKSEPWQLEFDAFPSLRQIAESAVDGESTDSRAEMVDKTIRNWGNVPSGLIALGQIRLPGNVIQLDSPVFEVGLESTVALHRSMDLIASEIKPALSGAALDAIMATLEQVASLETQPVAEPSALRTATATYPVVAAIAATVAVTARRRYEHAQSNLRFTRRSK